MMVKKRNQRMWVMKETTDVNDAKTKKKKKKNKGNENEIWICLPS